MSKKKERTTPSPRPPWLTVRVPCHSITTVDDCLADLEVDTVCRGARCPNRAECYGKGRATFMLLGPHCTRSCRFCAVDSKPPVPVDPTEPQRVAYAAARLKLTHVVITSVTRDDLPDGGATHFAETVAAVRKLLPRATIEILVPDFGGNQNAWGIAADAAPDVFNHNIETVPRLYATVRPEAIYTRSLDLLAWVKKYAPQLRTKSGLMVGLGETYEEVLAVGQDLAAAHVNILTVGQYLCPDPSTHLPVVRYVTPDEFKKMERELMAFGFSTVAAAPLVRSSYNAAETLQDSRNHTAETDEDK